MSVGGFDELNGAPVNGVPGIMDRIKRRITESIAQGQVFDAGTAKPVDAPEGSRARSQYAMLRALAENNNAYEELAELLADYDLGDIAVQGLANPVNAFCTFYESTMWMGTIREDDAASALPLEFPLPDAGDNDPDAEDTATNDTIILRRQNNVRKVAHRVWRWSNWNNVKETVAYEGALLGDQLFKTVSDPVARRVWFEMVQPEQMTEIRADSREYLRFLRLDVELSRRERGADVPYWFTRVWDKETGTERIWEHTHGADAHIEDLGEPTKTITMMQGYGVDFVPLVHWRFRASSNSERGVSGIQRALDKIVYMDLVKTSLFQRMHRHGVPDMVLVKQLVNAAGEVVTLGAMGDLKTITLGGGKILELPPGMDMKAIVSAIDFAAHLLVIQDHYDHLMRTDLPELVWNTVAESSTAESGKALEVRLIPAQTNVEKARGRAEAELIRITQMCMTIGQKMGIPGFGVEDIGTYENGDFDFWIADRPIIPMSRLDNVAFEQARALVLKTLTDAGASIEGAAEVAGYTPDEIELLMRSDIVLDTAPNAVYTPVPGAVQPGAADPAQEERIDDNTDADSDRSVAA